VHQNDLCDRTYRHYRLSDGGAAHIEDFAQIFRVYPDDKYRSGGYRNIAQVIAAEGNQADIVEFVRRLTFNTLIGNADMHLKNWSMIYRDRRSAALAPAYDFVSTVAYIHDDTAALKFSRTKRFDLFTEDELSHLAGKARLPEKLVLDTARENRRAVSSALAGRESKSASIRQCHPGARKPSQDDTHRPAIALPNCRSGASFCSLLCWVPSRINASGRVRLPPFPAGPTW
jgi:HipA-like C-terminal domain